MVDKRIIIGGFAIGVAAGTAILTFSAQTIPTTASDTASESASVQPTEPAPAQYSPNPPPAPPQSDFDRMVEQVAREQGGKISIRQMAALAEIYGQLHGVPPDRGSQFGGQRSRDVRSSYGADVAFNDPYATLGRSRSPTFGADGLTNSGRGSDDADGYRGSSGARYQYDLSNPGDQVRYSVDVDAQLRDSVDPRVEIDRSMGQHGGGIEGR